MKKLPFLFFLIIVVSILQPVSGLVIKLPVKSCAVGEEIEVPLTVQDAQDIGSMDIVVAYDPTILEVKSVGKGELVKGLFSSNMDKQGYITMAIADSKGINGDGSVAVVIFKALKEGESDLKISARAYDVNTHVDIKVDEQDGKITVTKSTGVKTPGFEIGIAVAALIVIGLALKRK